MNSDSTVQEHFLGHQNNYLMHFSWVTFVESLVCSMYMYHTYNFLNKAFYYLHTDFPLFFL